MAANHALRELGVQMGKPTPSSCIHAKSVADTSVEKYETDFPHRFEHGKTSDDCG